MEAGDRRRPPPFPMPLWERFVLGGLLLLEVFVFAILFRLVPDPRGYGTHEQLGMPPCSWPLDYGIPCPTCGVTTATVLVLHGRILAAFAAQPFGAVFALAGIWFLIYGIVHLVRGRSLFARMAFWPWPWILLGATVLLLLAWAYKARAGLGR